VPPLVRPSPSITPRKHLHVLLLLPLLCGVPDLHAQTAAWTEISDPSSPPFAHHDMTYDSLRRRLIVAGRTSIMQSEFAIYAGAADGSWTRLPSPEPPLPGENDVELAYDSGRDVVVLYAAAQSQVWEFDGTTWTVIGAPTAPVQCLDGAQLQYDPVHRKTVLVGAGGWPEADTPSETWLWDGVDWTLAADASLSPRGAAGGGMAFDAARGEMVLLTHSTMQTWVFDGAHWSQRTPATTPSPGVWVFDLAFDPLSGMVVFYGGEHLDEQEPWNSTHPTNTWAWDGADWTLLEPATTPPPNIDYALAFFPERNGLVLHGGWGPGSDWNFRTNVWLLTIENTPPGLASVEIAPAAANLTVGQTQIFVATGKDQAGNPATIAHPVWTASGGGTLSPQGTSCTYTGTLGGDHTITCAEDGTLIRGSAQIRVLFAIARASYEADTREIMLEWVRNPDQVYDVYRATRLAPTEWQLIGSGLDSSTWSETVSGLGAFYRVAERKRMGDMPSRPEAEPR